MCKKMLSSLFGAPDQQKKPAIQQSADMTGGRKSAADVKSTTDPLANVPAPSGVRKRRDDKGVPGLGL